MVKAQGAGWIALAEKIPGLGPGQGGAQYRPLHFHEHGYCIRTLEREEEFEQAYRLRHLVFCEELGWLSTSPEGLDIDKYDKWSTSLGIFNGQCGTHLVATLRLLPHDRPFMLEEEFIELLPPGLTLRKECDTTEISRFATARGSEAKEAHALSILLYKAWYQWSVCNSIRYVYLEVEDRYARKLRMMGFPAAQLGPSCKLPPAYADSVALLLDWEEFRATNSHKRPDFLAWMSRAQSVPAVTPRRRRVPSSRLATCSERSQHETVRFVH